jgi:hypothetical protein
MAGVAAVPGMPVVVRVCRMILVPGVHGMILVPSMCVVLGIRAVHIH